MAVDQIAEIEKAPNVTLAEELVGHKVQLGNRTVTLTECLGEGASGAVFRIDEEISTLVKIYHQRDDEAEYKSLRPGNPSYILGDICAFHEQNALNKANPDLAKNYELWFGSSVLDEKGERVQYHGKNNIAILTLNEVKGLAFDDIEIEDSNTLSDIIKAFANKAFEESSKGVFDPDFSNNLLIEIDEHGLVKINRYDLAGGALDLSKVENGQIIYGIEIVPWFTQSIDSPDLAFIRNANHYLPKELDHRNSSNEQDLTLSQDEIKERLVRYKYAAMYAQIFKIAKYLGVDSLIEFSPEIASMPGNNFSRAANHVQRYDFFPMVAQERFISVVKERISTLAGNSDISDLTLERIDRLYTTISEWMETYMFIFADGKASFSEENLNFFQFNNIMDFHNSAIAPLFDSINANDLKTKEFRTVEA